MGMGNSRVRRGYMTENPSKNKQQILLNYVLPQNDYIVNVKRQKSPLFNIINTYNVTVQCIQEKHNDTDENKFRSSIYLLRFTTKYL